jgi:hypothetical protein
VHAGVFWTVNDSGHPPVLFAVDRSGKLMAEYRVQGAVNLDWEALATDDRGNLYIGDVGNNTLPGGWRRRWVYRLKQPNPSSAPASGPREVTVDRTYTYSFPDKPFDVEAMFFHSDNLYLVSKVRGEPTKLYRLPLDQPGQAVPLAEACELPHVAQVTDASLAADGRRLAVCSYGYVALFALKVDEPLENLRDRVPTVVHFPAKIIEGCTWDGEDLILASEDREVFRLRFPPR